MKENTNLNIINDIYKKIAASADKDVADKILRFKPINKDEFNSIYNFTPRLLQKNASLIMELESLLLEERVSKIDRKVFVTINALQGKLTNISQKNNMIWNSKESPERLLDLSKLVPKSQDEVNKLLNELNSKTKIGLEINEDDVKKRAAALERELKSESKTEKSLLSKAEIFDTSIKRWFHPLYLENKRLVTEKGRTSLYVSPITFLGKVDIDGKMVNVRAPLFLFPVNIELNKQRTSWLMSNDNGRGVIVNDFVKSYCVNDFEYEYDELKDLEFNIGLFLEKFSNVVDKREDKYQPFIEKPKEIEGDFKLNNFVIRKNILMGIFAEFGDSIQNEVKDQIKTNKIPTQLSKFVSEKDVNSIEVTKRVEDNYEKTLNDDSGLFYTNNLDTSQLEALKKINDPDSFGLTIWGPPGTGKSETIISIIQDSIAKKKRVLVVSEKQAALSVISNRLGNLKKTSIVISDEKNKKRFFDQLKENFDKAKEELDLEKGVDKNKDILDSLNEIEKIYGEKNYIKEVNKIYTDKYYFNNDVSKILSEHVFRNFKFKDLESFFKIKEDIDSIKSIEEAKVLDIINDGNALTFESLKPYREFIRKEVADLRGTLMDNEEILSSIDLIKEKIKISKGEIPGSKKDAIKELTTKLNINKKHIKNFDEAAFKSETNAKVKELTTKLKEVEEINSLIETNYNEFEKIFHLDKMTLPFLKTIVKTYKPKQDFELHRRNIVSALIEKIMLEPSYQSYLKVIEEFHSIRNNVKKDTSLLKKYNNIVINNSLNEVIKENRYTEKIDAFEKMINRENPPAIKKFMKDFPIETKNQIRIWLLQPEIVPLMFDRNEIFDVVIFDEASQMFMERAIPAISRSKKIVVLGDEKQLGPSNFFAGRIGEDSDEELFDINESLLSYSKAKLPTIMLKNHYRSEKLSLINFSNENYYDGKLNFINSVNTQFDNEIEYHFVEGATYIDQVNKKEAKKVIEVLERLKKDGYKGTIGIITINQKQQEIIENKVFFDSKLVIWAKERNLFVKSLENVQGDERDIIIIATNYANDSSGKLRMNFGPISSTMGSNRINVAITRSRQKMIVVSSINLDEARSKFPKLKNQGPKDFINFISYAKDVSEGEFDYKKKANTKEEIKFDNIFKEAVYDEIVSELKTKYKLGIYTDYKTLGYKIDFVLYDLTSKKEIIAIELDYLVKRTSSKARERDFLEENFLVIRGWSVYRIWSTDWWRDKEMSKKRLFVEIESILKNRKSSKK